MRLLATTHVIPSRILWHESHLHHGHEQNRCCWVQSQQFSSEIRVKDIFIGTGNKESRVNVGNY